MENTLTKSFGILARKASATLPVSIRLSPLPVTVTTRIITFLVGDPNLNLHLPQASWEGGQPLVNVAFANQGDGQFDAQLCEVHSSRPEGLQRGRNDLNELKDVEVFLLNQARMDG